MTKPWKPWLSASDGEFLGFVKEYGKFSIATVHGHGHSALLTQYEEVPLLLNRFIFDLPLA